MKRDFISISGLKKVLSPKELKNITGGSNTCWCFCDGFEDGDGYSFEAKCPNDGSNCWELSCPGVNCGPPVC